MSTEEEPSPKKNKLDTEYDFSEMKSPNTAEKSFYGVSNTVHRLYLTYVWQETSYTDKHITVSIILHSGVKYGDFTLWVIEYGDVLELTVDWPRSLLDISYMNKKCLHQYDFTFSDIHAKCLGFEAPYGTLVKT